MTKKLFLEICEKPFVEFLRRFVKLGADPNAVIGKLKMYRDLE